VSELYFVGDYKIEVSYFDCPLTCSPFLVKAWDVSKVCISEVRTGHVSAPCSFKSKSLVPYHIIPYHIIPYWSRSLRHPIVLLLGNQLVIELGLQERNSKILLTLIVAKHLPKNVD